jgi:dTDP-4-amino-4,6-dideoxygalactose transaminase
MSNFKVPFWKLELSPDSIEKALGEVRALILEGTLIGGPRIRQIESKFGERICKGEVVGVANGLEGLEIALRALGIKPGNLVAVPSHTFIAVWLAVIRVGATPYPIPPDRRGQMNIDYFENLKLNFNAVIPAHMHGASTEIVRLVDYARKKKIIVIEDCSQAAGLKIGSSRIGEFGDAAVFSLYPTKNVAAVGDAGLIVFRNSEDANLAKKLTNYGTNPNDKYKHEIIGMNSRLDPIQTPFISASIDNLDSVILARRRIASKYLEAIRNSNSIKPLIDSVDDSVWHHFVIMVESREDFIRKALCLGIQVDIHYPIPPSDEISKLLKDSSFKCEWASTFTQKIVSIPIYKGLSEQQTQLVVELLENY